MGVGSKGETVVFCEDGLDCCQKYVKGELEFQIDADRGDSGDNPG